MVQNALLFRTRVSIEAVGFLLRCIVCYYLVWSNSAFGDSKFGNDMLAFAYAQLSYAVVLLIGYSFMMTKRIDNKLWPVSSPKDFAFKPHKGDYFDPVILRLVASLTGQSVLKHLLTQGDMLIMSSLAPLNDQGVFAVVNNYGSLVARIILQPIEETSRTIFSKLIGELNVESGARLDRNKLEGAYDNVKIAFGLLELLVKWNILLGSVFTFIGSNYADLFVRIVLGSKWIGTGVQNVLAFYFVYILFMAVNGVLEAFVFAVYTEKQVLVWNRRMVYLSAVFVIAGVLFVNIFGSIGLIAANCINMTGRIILCVLFIQNYRDDYGKVARKRIVINLRDCLPHWQVVLTLIGCFSVTYLSNSLQRTEIVTLKYAVGHVAIGVGCFALFGLILYRKEGDFIRKIMELIKDKSVKDIKLE
jgi:oligosaccharide translocation protein RFT1